MGNLAYTRVDRGYNGLRLHGNFGISSFVPVNDSSSVSSDRSISFTEDGRFYAQNFVGFAVGPPNSRFGGAGTSQAFSAGTYRIAANAIELTDTDGQRQLLTFFHYEEDAVHPRPGLIALDGVHLLRRGDPILPAPAPTPAQPNVKVRMRAGEIAGIEVQQGDADAARQLANLFAGSRHLYLENGQLLIVTADGKEQIVTAPYQLDPETQVVTFAGESGNFQVKGALFQGNDGKFYTLTRLQVPGESPIDVAFLQPMEMLEP